MSPALAARVPGLVRLGEPHPTPSRELWMPMHPSCREVRRMDLVACWLAERVAAFLATP